MTPQASIPSFVAIDFETANNSPDSACAVGVALVRDGTISRSFQRLIRPPTTCFSEWNFRIHGIHWSHVQDEADFAHVWASILPEIGNAAFFAAHNAGFDQRVLAACCELYGIEPPDKDFVCTIEVASSMWGLESYKLSRVCQFLSIPLVHHNPQSDAEGSATILLKAMAHGYGLANPAVSTVSAWAAKHLSAEIMQVVSAIMEDGRVEPAEILSTAHWMENNKNASSVWPGSELKRLLGSILRDEIIDEEELEQFRPLCITLLGLHERKKTRRACKKKPGAMSVCFTGFGPRKEELREQAEAAGYHVAGSVTVSLDYLVAGPEPGPSKMQKAQERGARVVSLDEWRAILEARRTGD